MWRQARVLAVPLAVIAATQFSAVHTAGAATLVDDGALCWFSDPRAVTAGNTTVVGWVSSAGDVGVTQYDRTTGSSMSTVLGPKFEVDDHDNPSFLVLPDGRLSAFYSRHSVENFIYQHTTLKPYDASAWTGPTVLSPTTRGSMPYGITYSNPHRLADGRVALFFRGINWAPSLMVSTDAWASSWGPAAQVFNSSSGQRPYHKCVPDARGRVHMTFTDGHPRDVPTNKVYYAYLNGSTYYRADGTPIKSIDAGPLAPADVDLVYDASQGAGWVWDIAITPAGLPVIVFATFTDNSRQHAYRYAAYTPGKGWDDYAITPAGSWFPQTPPGEDEFEKQYSGGVSLDHGDPSVVYLSREVNGVFEIEQWWTRDGGLTWASQAITKGSKQHNVRPFLPWQSGPTPGPRLLMWQRIDHYRVWFDYKTSIEMLQLA